MDNFFSSIQSFGVPLFGPLGAGMGEYFFLVTSKASTNKYYQKLINSQVGDDRIFTTVSSAYSNMTGDQNDVLFITPGDHAVTAAVTWAKNRTFLIGLGGPNQRQQPSTLTSGGCRIKCVTTAVAEIFDVTGNYVSMYGFGTMNNAANTGNLYDVLVEGRNFYAEGMSFRGGNNTTQNQNASAGIPLGIGAAGYAHTFVNCQIGQAGNTARTTGPGYVKFITGTPGCGGIKFIDCTFEMQSATDGANASGFLVQQTSLDRLTQFINCSFYNFSENWGATPDYLFNIDQTTTFDIILRNCSMAGFDIVSDSARVKTSDAAPNSAGVESVAVATT